MNHQRFHALIDAWREETLSEADASELSAILRQDEDARRIFKDEAHMHGLLHRTVAAAAVEWTAGNLPGSGTLTGARSQVRWFGGKISRPMIAAAAGLALGAFCTSALWALAESRPFEPKRTNIPLAVSRHSETRGRIPSGFPTAPGIMSGDVAELVSVGAGRVKSSGKLLRFVTAEPEPNIPGSPAHSCDVYQLVDLSALHPTGKAGDASLEFSVSFADGRAETDGAIRFSCRMFVFSGSPQEILRKWPATISESLSSSSQHFTPEAGAKGPDWHPLVAKCILPENASFAILQVVASRVSGAATEGAAFGEQFADEMQLVLKTVR
jgi:hypothetical protein